VAEDAERHAVEDEVVAGPLTIRKSTPDPPPAAGGDGYDPEKSLAAHTRRIFNVKPEDEKEPLTRSTLAVADTIDWLMRNGPTQVKQGLSEMLDGEIAKGGVKAVRGTALTAGAILAPSIARAAIAAPAAVATDIGLGTAVGAGTYKTVKPGARMMGATEDQAELAAEIAGFATGIPTSIYGTPRVLSAVEQGAARLGWRPGGGTPPPPPPPPPGAPPGPRPPLQVTFQPTTAAAPPRPQTAPVVPAAPLAGGGARVSAAPGATPAQMRAAAPLPTTRAQRKEGRWFDDLIRAAPPTKKINYKRELAESALPHIEAHAVGDLTTGENTFDVAIDSADNAVKFMHERSAQLIDATPNARLKTDPLAKAESRLAQHEDTTFLSRGVASLLERYPILRTPGQLSLKRADRIRWELSQRNRAALRENKWDIGNLRATDPVFAADEQAMIALREGVYGGLEDEGIAGVAAMRRAEGDVIEFRDMLGQHAFKGENKVPGTGLARSAHEAILALPVLPYRGRRALGAAADVLVGGKNRNELLAQVFRRRAGTAGPRPSYPSLPAQAPPVAAVATPGRAAAPPPATQPFRPPVVASAAAPPVVPGVGRPAPRPAGPMVPGLGRPAPPPPPPPAPPAPPPNVPGLGRPMPATVQRPPVQTGARAGSRWVGSPLDAEAKRMGVWLNDEQLALADALMRKYQRNAQQAILTVIEKAPLLATQPPVPKQLPAPSRVLVTPPPAPTPQPPATRVTPGAVAARDAWGRPTQFSGDPGAVDVPFPPRGPQGPFNPPPGAAPPGAPPLGPGPMGPFNPPGTRQPGGGGPAPAGAAPVGAAPGRVTAKMQIDETNARLAAAKAAGREVDPQAVWEQVQREMPIVNPEPAPSPEGSNVPRMARGEAPVRPAPAAPRPTENTIDAAVARSGAQLSPVQRQLADAAMTTNTSPADDVVRIVSEMSDEQAQTMLDEFLEFQRAQAEPAPRNLGGLVEEPEPPASTVLDQSVIDEPIGSDIVAPPVAPRTPAGKKKDPVAEGKRRRPNRQDHELTPGELQARLHEEGVTLSLRQIERVQALRRAGATREDAVTSVLQGVDVADTNRLLQGGAADANALADSRPDGLELHAGTHLRRRPDESPHALTKRRRDAQRAAYNARYIDHYRDLFDIVAAHAKQVEPDVNLETLQAAFDERVAQHEELVSQYLESPDNPQLLLKEIARKGGINTEDSTFPGEVKRLLEGVQFGRFGGVEGVFRKGGKSLSDIATDLTREGVRGQDNTFAHLEEQGGKLADLLDWAGANPPRYEEGVLPGSDKLSDLGVELDRPWWRSAEKAPPAGDEPPKVDVLDTGEEQPRLPGAGDVRDQNIETPKIELPFSLSGGVSERPQGTTADLFGNRPPEPEPAPKVAPPRDELLEQHWREVLQKLKEADAAIGKAADTDDRARMRQAYDDIMKTQAHTLEELIALEARVDTLHDALEISNDAGWKADDWRAFYEFRKSGMGPDAASRAVNNRQPAAAAPPKAPATRDMKAQANEVERLLTRAERALDQLDKKGIKGEEAEAIFAEVERIYKMPEQTPEDFQAVIDALNGAQDRANALLGAAMKARSGKRVAEQTAGWGDKEWSEYNRLVAAGGMLTSRARRLVNQKFRKN